MGRLSNKFNAKARKKSVVDTAKAKEENLKNEQLILKEPCDDYKSTRDESNALVTFGKNKLNNVKDDFQKKKTKILSKKQRKKLENIVQQKKKKGMRADILKSLSEVQVSTEELSMYNSTSRLGQKINLKRKEVAADNSVPFSSTAKRNRKKRKKTGDNCNPQNDEVVSLMQLSESSSSDSEEDIEENNEEDGEVEKSSEDVVEDIQISDEKNKTEESSKINDTDTYSNKEIQETVAVENPLKETSKTSQQENQQSSEKNDDSKKNNLTENLTAKIQAKSKKEYSTPVFVEVKRTDEIQAARLLLPILPEEQVVMEIINENDVVVICGSTGSGKTTQVPQFLYEAGYGSHSSRPGLIGITEPRRVAAVSMSKRVAHEMNMSQSQISYQIRYEGNSTDKTKIKFMTDGVLLKEMEKDFMLTKYSSLIIDEAHERSVYTDILIGLLSRVVPLRKKQNLPLKLIIMSATLRIEDFTENKRLFTTPPPVIKVDSRQYPVTTHFNRRTVDDYVTESFKKVCKIHRTLKLDGGILIFLTGQNEVIALCKKLRRAFPYKNVKTAPQLHEGKTKKRKTYESSEVKKPDLPTINLDNYSTGTEKISYEDIDEDDDLKGADTFNSDDDEYENVTSGDDMDDSAYTAAADASLPLYVLPLYSLLSTERQAKVFTGAPEGYRLCVVATNVAETSLTIPGIRYIVDSGKVKKKFYDKVTGVSTFRIVWTSKASANQRAGRAGRVGPGHCYRLYSSAVFQNDFEEFSEPEICRRPVDDLVLQMKSMCIDKVVNFPFPTPPDAVALRSAEKLLLDLGGLKKQKTKQGTELAVISPLGTSLSKIPVSPRYAKMIILSSKHDGCLPYVIAIVAALTVKEIFTDDIDLSSIEDLDAEDLAQKRKLITVARRKWAGDGPSSLLGDLMVILRAVGACEYTGCSEKFCKQNGLRYKAMTEIRKLRAQLTNAVNAVNGIDSTFVDPKMNPPSDEQSLLIRKIVLTGLADHVARKIPPDEAKSLKIRNAYRSCSTEDPVFIHPTSSLFSKLPEFVVYHEIMETSKLYMKTLLSIQEEWLPIFAPYLCTLGKPLEEPPPSYCPKDGNVKVYMTCTFGPHVWQLPANLLPYPEKAEKYRWFAKYLLGGEVVEKLEIFSSSLLTPASVMIKSWAHLQPKTERMFRALAEERVDSREKLLKLWKKQPKYLLKQYLEWLPQSKHEDLRKIWPPNG